MRPSDVLASVIDGVVVGTVGCGIDDDGSLLWSHWISVIVAILVTQFAATNSTKKFLIKQKPPSQLRGGLYCFH